jgi:hypothetical protein
MAGGSSMRVLATIALALASTAAGCTTSGTEVPPPSACAASSFPDEPASPVDYGRRELLAALLAAKTDAKVRVVLASEDASAAALVPALDARAESFGLASANGETLVIGRDAVGAMYGALELAEKLRARGASALPLAGSVLRAPELPIRATNLYLVMPDKAAGEACWYFRDASYWREYLDTMARARMNFLDLHAMYNQANTLSPNALLYFARSAAYPEIGIDPLERDRNVDMLNTVVAMAKARGIEVGLLTARIDLSTTADEGFVSPLDDAGLQKYTREAVADVARRVPGLARLGVRIGESTKDAQFYEDTFVAGLRDAGHAKLYARTWLTTKPEMLRLVNSTDKPEEVIVEAKYAGEQLGTPYVPASFVEQGWRPSYLYEGYLEEPAPYTFIFQIWASSTYRFFRYASYERTQRLVKALRISPRVKGFSMQTSHTYNAQRDYWHADARDRISEWAFRRDELEILLFGRLGYDPETPIEVFREALRARVGAGAEALWEAEQAASDLVGWIQNAHGCGADSREFAAQLEWTGSTRYWALPPKPPAGSVPGNCGTGYHGPYDAFAIASSYETAQDLLAQNATPRVSSRAVAQIVLDDARRARQAKDVAIDEANAEARDVRRECIAVADLGDYFGHKLRAATALAVYEGSAAPAWLATAKDESAQADAAWRGLAEDTRWVKTFDEPVRMGYLGLRAFHWQKQVAYLDDDPRSIEQLATEVAAKPPVFTGQLPSPAAWLDAPRADSATFSDLAIDPPDPRAPTWSVTATFASALPADARAAILWKPFHSNTSWTRVEATVTADRATARIDGGGAGGLFAVEVISAGAGRRFPDVVTKTPYVVLAP